MQSKDIIFKLRQYIYKLKISLILPVLNKENNFHPFLFLKAFNLET